MSQSDAQFYAELISNETQKAAERDAAYNRAILATRESGPDMWTKFGMDLIGDFAGGGAQGAGMAVAGMMV